MVSFFVEADCLTAIQFRAETGNHPDKASERCGLISADSGLQLDLEIALSGVSAKEQPHELLSSAEDALKRRVT